MSLNKRIIEPSSTVPIENFNVVTYSGSGSSLEVDNGFQADLIWTKCRNVEHHWGAFDSTIGVRHYLTLNNSTALSEGNGAGNYGVETFGSSSTTFYGNRGRSNSAYLNGTYVAYFWKAGGSTSSNSNGSITSAVSANAARGVSVLQYTGNGNSGSTVGHGLGAAPEMIIIKSITNSYEWKVWHTGLSSGNQVLFNTAGQASDSSVFTTTTPTSTVFSIGNNVGTNGNNAEYVAYCFRSITGYVKVGTYTGNGSYNHAISTGFEPGMVLLKSIGTSGENWSIFDSARGGNIRSYVNAYATEESGTEFAFSSTGFVLPKWGSMNQNGVAFIYIAFKIN